MVNACTYEARKHAKSWSYVLWGILPDLDLDVSKYWGYHTYEQTVRWKKKKKKERKREGEKTELSPFNFYTL